MSTTDALQLATAIDVVSFLAILAFVVKGAAIGLVGMGAFVATRPGMIFGPIGSLAERMKARGGFLQFMGKPLGTCPRCMCSTWGLGAMLLAGIPIDPLQVPALLAIGAGLQAIFDQ